MKSKETSRIRILSFGIIFFALCIIVRLYYLQVIQHDFYIDKADRQYSRSSSNTFSRGSIFFTDKTGTLISAASLKTGFTLAVNPTLLKNPDEVFTKLSTYLPTLSYNTFIAQATKKNDPYEEVAKRVDYDTGVAIDKDTITGLQVYKDRWRFYPASDLAPQVIGFMGYKGDEYAGRYGLERFYEKTLAKTDNGYQNFFAQIFSNIKEVTGNAQEGDIVTSLEPHVQAYFQGVLADVTKKYNSEYTAGIIIDPKDGRIIAMAIDPGFDLNNIKEQKDVKVFSNPLVENVYEMGSVVKPLTVSAGIDAGVITPQTTYTDNGFIIVNNKKISNFDGKSRGTVTIQEALSESLNVGMAFIVSRLGNERFTEYFNKFGLGQKTNIDLPNEGKSLIDTLNTNRDIEHVTASFGQNIALTPIALVRALSVIANGGRLIEPHLVTRINYASGLSKNISFPPGEQVISPKTAETVTSMMVKSVDQYLQNGKFKMDHFSVAVKTGTAQIIGRDGTYSKDDFLHSFVGFAPAYNPRFLIFMYTVKPRGVQYSSESLSQPFFDTMQFLLNYYEVPPDR
jgi:cell division protein FtsI/penicillin-binding protein 2